MAAIGSSAFSAANPTGGAALVGAGSLSATTVGGIAYTVMQHYKNTKAPPETTITLQQTNFGVAAETMAVIEQAPPIVNENVEQSAEIQLVLRQIEQTLETEIQALAHFPLDDACHSFVMGFIQSARELKRCAAFYRTGQETQKEFLEKFDTFTKKQFTFCTQVIMQYMGLFNRHQNLLLVTGEALGDTDMTIARLGQLQRQWRRQNIEFPNTPEDAQKLLEIAKRLSEAISLINENRIRFQGQ